MARLPVISSAKRTYFLLWRHRRLHVRAIWIPCVFLVTAEFLYHKIMGNSHTLTSHLDATLASPLSAIATALLWLAGLKFLLSFSISWRRHLLLKEKFDPRYFKKPFWTYLAALLIVYVGGIGLTVFTGMIDNLFPGLQGNEYRTRGFLQSLWDKKVFLITELGTVAFIIWAIIRSVPIFTALALGDDQTTIRKSFSLMRGNVLRYIALWLMVMIPVAIPTLLLHLANKTFDIDMENTAVALSEGLLSQASLFIHVSLGASIGALTYNSLVRGNLPVAIE